MDWGFFDVALRLPGMEGSDSAAVSARSLAGSRLGAACAEPGATPERETGGLGLGDGAGRFGTGAATASGAEAEPVKVVGKVLLLEVAVGLVGDISGGIVVVIGEAINPSL